MKGPRASISVMEVLLVSYQRKDVGDEINFYRGLMQCWLDFSSSVILSGDRREETVKVEQPF
jgi:hypothetical protein